MKILESVELTYTNRLVNSNKFYKLKLVKHEGRFTVEALYGRKKSRGAKSRWNFEDEHKAREKYQTTLRSKIDKGYCKTIKFDSASQRKEDADISKRVFDSRMARILRRQE